MVSIDLEKNKLKTVENVAYYVPNFITEEQESYIMKKVDGAPKPKWCQLKNRRLQNWGGIPHTKGLIPEKIPDWLQGFVGLVESLQVFPTTNKPNHVLVNEYLPGQGIMPHLDGSLFFPTISTINCGSHTVLNFYKPLKEILLHWLNLHHAYQDSANENCPNQTFDTDKFTSYCMNVILVEILFSNLLIWLISIDNDVVSNEKVYSILLERRSLLVLQENMYYNYMHGIEEIKDDVIDDNISNLKSCNLNLKNGSSLPRSKRISLTIRNVPKVSKLNLNSLLINK